MRVGIVGMGIMGQNHARTIMNLDKHEFIGFFDPKETQIRLHGEQFKSETSVAILQDKKPDYLVIAAPTNMHFDCAMESIRKNIPFLLEKPITNSSSTARILVRECERRKLKAVVGHIERYNDAILEARKIINQGLMGNIIAITSIRSGPYGKRIRDTGVILDLATHDIDLVRFLSQSEMERPAAIYKNLKNEQHEDILYCIGSTSTGILYNMQINWISPLKERITTVICENGMIRVDTLTSEITIIEQGSIEIKSDELKQLLGETRGSVRKIELARQEPLITQHLNFTKWLKGEETNIVTLEDGLVNLLVAEKILNS